LKELGVKGLAPSELLGISIGEALELLTLIKGLV
jgi:hypothetical protein